MSIFDFSGKFGYPEGAFTRLNQKDDLDLDPGSDIGKEVTDPGGGGGGTAVWDWAAIDDDASVIQQTSRNTMSASHEGEGTYFVDCTTSAPFEPICTPRSVEIVDPEIAVLNRQWFTTTSPDNYDAHAVYDPEKDLVWGTDVDHNTSLVNGLPDRIAIGNMFAETPEVYLYLPSAFPVLFRQNGDTLVLDLEFRLAYVQATSTSGTRTTLIYNMDSYALLQSSNSITGGSQVVIIGHTSTHFLMRGDGNIFVYSRNASGLVNGLTDTEADMAIGFKWGMRVNDDTLWYRDSGAPADWRQISIAGGSFSSNTRDAGTDGIADRIYDYNPVTNELYYLNNNSSDLHLMKILCASPFTVTELNSTAYDSTLADPTITIVGIVTIRFTPDYSQIIAIRGQGSTDTWFYLLNPADGSIDVEMELPQPLGVNYGIETIISLGGVVVTIGSRNLQIISYTVGEGGSSNTQEPVVIHARSISNTRAIVEIYISHDAQRRKIDAPFNIYFVRD